MISERWRPRVHFDFGQMLQITKLYTLLPLHQQVMQKYDIAFIRHAESKINQATRQIAHKYNIPSTYNALKGYPQWTEKVKYSMDYVDCPLSQVGIEQCQNARKKADELQPDVILVSPLERTLQTCECLFGGRDIPVFVEPILTEAIRSSCDLCTDINPKMQRFPKYNFQGMPKDQDYWNIYYDEEHIDKYLQRIKMKGAITLEEKNSAVLGYMSEFNSYETPANVKQRVKKIKQLIKKYREKYGTIAVVAHFNTINYTVAKEFDEGNQPKNSVKMHNCEFYYTTYAEIDKYS